VRPRGHLYAHLDRERGRRNAVVMRVRVYEHFRLGATDVIEAPHEDMIKSYTSFAEAAAAVHKRLYGDADARPESIYWKDYVAYIRHSLPHSSDSNRAHQPAGDGPFNRSHRRATLPCRFYIEGITSYTHASPELADLEVESLRTSDGSGEWVRVGHLRPFVPPGVGLAAIPGLVKRAIQNKRHHQRRSYSLTALRKRRRHEREQDDDDEEEGQVPEVELYGGGRQGRVREGASKEGKQEYFGAGGARAAGACDSGAYPSERDADERRRDAEHESVGRFQSSSARGAPNDWYRPGSDDWDNWDNCMHTFGGGDARQGGAPDLQTYDSSQSPPPDHGVAAPSSPLPLPEGEGAAKVGAGKPYSSSTITAETHWEAEGRAGSTSFPAAAAAGTASADRRCDPLWALSRRDAPALSSNGHDERRRSAAGPLGSSGLPAHPPRFALPSVAPMAAASTAPAPSASEAASEVAREAKRKKVKSLDAGELVFVDWLRVPKEVLGFTQPELPALIVSSEAVRMHVGGARCGENSPLDVQLAPWSRDGLAADPATHFVVPRNHLIKFTAGFRDMWAQSARAEERARAVHASLLDAIEYIVEFRRRRKPTYPGADQMWRNMMGEEPLPARFCAGEGE